MKKATETNVSSVKTKTGSNNNACIITGSGEITFFLNGSGDVVTENNGVYIVKFSHDDTGKITDSITVTDMTTLKKVTVVSGAVVSAMEHDLMYGRVDEPKDFCFSEAIMSKDANYSLFAFLFCVCKKYISIL